MRQLVVVFVVLFCILACPVMAQLCPKSEELCKSSKCRESCKAHVLNLTCSHEPITEDCYCGDDKGRHPITGVCVDEGCCPSKEDFDYNSVEDEICFGYNEEYGIKNAAGEECELSPLYYDQEVAYKGCYCKEGHFRNNEGDCVEYCFTEEIEEEEELSPRSPCGDHPQQDFRVITEL